jgi:hypothetical protein
MIGNDGRKPAMNARIFRGAISVTALLLASATAAEAYIGPGAGLSAIGSVVSVISAIFMAIAGFVWYPIKRFFKRSGTATPARRANVEAGIEPAHK